MKKNIFNNPRFKHGTLATIITVIVIAAVVLLNVVATLLLERYPLTIDLTADKRFTLTEESQVFVSDLKTDITMKVCVAEEVLKGEGVWYKQVYEILKNYTKYGDKVKLDFVDLSRTPTFAQNYPQYSLALGDVIVESNLRSKKISINDMIKYNQTEYNDVVYSSEAEQVITSALMYVVDDNPTKVSMLTGLDNVDVKNYADLLTHNNYEIVEQNLLSEDIAEDADIILMGAPSTDISAEDAQKLETFLDNNGEFNKSLIFVADYEKPVGPVLKNFLADWGLEVGAGVIGETNQQNSINNVFTILTNVVDEEVNGTLKNASLPTITKFANPINLLFETDGNRKTSSILSTSESTCIVPLDADQNFDLSAQETSSHSVIAKSIRTKYINKETKVSTVIAIGSKDMLTTNYLQNAAFSNGDLGVVIANQLTHKEDAITMLPVQFADKTITITQDQVKVYRNIFMIAVPILLIGLGIFIFARRRHL